jgi:hypothetical protein
MSTAKIVAKLVEAGHADLAEQLITAATLDELDIGAMVKKGLAKAKKSVPHMWGLTREVFSETEIEKRTVDKIKDQLNKVEKQLANMKPADVEKQVVMAVEMFVGILASDAVKITNKDLERNAKLLGGAV